MTGAELLKYETCPNIARISLNLKSCKKPSDNHDAKCLPDGNANETRTSHILKGSR